MRFTTGLVAALAGTAFALPSSDHVIHEKRSNLAAHGIAKERAASAEYVMPMRVALKQKNLHQIPKLLDDVSNPTSKNYGKHWTGDELAHKFGPTDASIRTVRTWLKSAGIKAKVSANRHWIDFEATVEQAEGLLKTKFNLYRQGEDAKEQIGCDEYSLPGHVREHVDFVTPTVSLGKSKRAIRKRQAPQQNGNGNVQTPVFKPIGTDGAQAAEEPVPMASNLTAPSVQTCVLGATPDCIRTIYGIPKGKTAAMGNPLGIYESEDYYDQQDLDAFFTTYAPEIENGTAPMLNSIDGGLAPPGTGQISGESVLDLEVVYPLIHPQGVRLLQVDDPAYTHSSKKGHFDSLLDALDADFCTFMGGDNSTFDFEYPDNQTSGWNGTKMCGTYTPPTVLSISYGYRETEFSPAYLQRQCMEFAKLAMAGTTVVVSSGDSGPSAPYCANPKIRTASPQFPASCPWVTTVGATMLDQYTGNNDLKLTDDGAEIVAIDGRADFKTGSGFSNVFDMPEWQKDVVQKYLAAMAANASLSTNSTTKKSPMVPGQNFNPNGRAYPDVAALGTNITTITNQRSFNADGTSASAPIFASMITLINEERLSQGKGPVGFINPAIYQAKGDPNIFRDVTSGNNGGCGMGGFSASKGWDAASGWGTPKYEGLKELLLSLP